MFITTIHVITAHEDANCFSANNSAGVDLAISLREALVTNTTTQEIAGSVEPTVFTHWCRSSRLRENPKSHEHE